MLEVETSMGDITQVRVDALVTLVNSGGLWFGGIDGAIQRSAGKLYHSQLGEVLSSQGLTDGQVVTIKWQGEEHYGWFNDVVFVVDDLESPLGELVLTALEEAHRNGYDHISMPLMRSGVMRGMVEKDTDAVITQMQEGIRRFNQAHPDSWLKVTIVVYRDTEAFSSLQSAFA